ncbi:HNH endonuclease [Clostridium sp. JN-9]|nr:HNH endonuclease [Clostridium sp. JN-9]
MSKPKWETVKDKLVLVEGWARDGLTDEQIAKNLGIGKTAFYKYKKEHTEFANTLKKGKEVVDFEVENALLKRALGYTYEEITKERTIDGGQRSRHVEGKVELTEQDWLFALAYFKNQCCYCGESSNLTKDHIIPVKAGGAYTRNNIIPCCKSCNSSKNSNDMLEWYEKQPFFSQDRLDKIYEYVGFINRLMSVETRESTSLITTKIIKKEVPPDVTAQIFWLKNRKPGQWRDKQDIEHSGNMTVNNPYKDLSTEELKRLAQMSDEDG